MTDLIARLEAATGPAGWIAPTKSSIPYYTASLDAALSLLPDGWAWLVEDVQVPEHKASARLWIPSQRTRHLPVENICVLATTPALALLIAILKARATGETKA